MSKLPLQFLVLCLAACGSNAAEKNYRITIAAGDSDRKEAVVSFAPPLFQTGDSFYHLRGEGEIIPLQLDGNGQAWLVVPNLKKGATKTYDLVKGGSIPAPDNSVQVQREGSVLKISSAGW